MCIQVQARFASGLEKVFISPKIPANGVILIAASILGEEVREIEGDLRIWGHSKARVLAETIDSRKPDFSSEKSLFVMRGDLRRFQIISFGMWN